MKHILILILLTLFTLWFDLRALCADKPAHHATGWKSSPTHSVGMKQFVHHPSFSATPIPARAIISTGLPPVYDQGQEGSCVANASTAAFEFAWNKEHKVFIGGSRQFIYRLLLQHDGTYPQDAGSTTSSAVWVLTNKGLAPERMFPYSNSWTVTPPPAAFAYALQHHAAQAYDVDNTDHISIKKAVAAGFPVMFGGYVYNSIENLTPANPFNAPNAGQGAPIGGHERLIVGYDSTLSHIFVVTNPNGTHGAITITGFYRVRNSWGTGWGDGGYSWEPMVDIENPQYNEDFAVLSLTE